MPSILKRSISLFLLFTLVFGAMLAAPHAAQATVIPVTTLSDQNGEDSSNCSLREAIISINKGSAFGGCVKPSGIGDVIVLPAGTYTLTKAGKDDQASVGDLDILRAVTISGAGPGVTVIEAGSGLQDRVFHIISGSMVMLSNLTVKSGNVNSYSISARLGGGIFNDQGSKLSLFKVAVSNNTADASNGSGGGLANMGTAYVNASTFSGNKAYTGGGIYNNGWMDVQASLFHGNTGNNNAGGVDHRPFETTDVLTITNSTLAGNTSPQGAALATAGKVTLKNVTVANNTGRAVELSGLGDLTFANTIIVRNSAVNCYASPGTRVTTLGYNLEDKKDCRLTHATDKVNITAPVLAGSLANNEGPTLTYALVAGANPAVNVIPLGNCPGTDQRFLGRGGPSTCDIGAYEDGAVPLNLTVNLPIITR